MAGTTIYYLTHPDVHTDDGGNPVCTVLTDDGQAAVVLFTDESAAQEFCDVWFEEQGWQVGYMPPKSLMRWLGELPNHGVPLALVDPSFEGPNALSGEVYDAAELAAELADAADPKSAKPKTTKPKTAKNAPANRPRRGPRLR